MVPTRRLKLDVDGGEGQAPLAGIDLPPACRGGCWVLWWAPSPAARASPRPAPATRVHSQAALEPHPDQVVHLYATAEDCRSRSPSYPDVHVPVACKLYSRIQIVDQREDTSWLTRVKMGRRSRVPPSVGCDLEHLAMPRIKRSERLNKPQADVSEACRGTW